MFRLDFSSLFKIMSDVKKKVLVAVSGGPDSMALLDMVKDKYECYVAHVNYHHRDSALRDENIVRDFCLKYNIPFFKEDYVESSGNFQERARIFRYEFFKDLVNEYHLDCVLIARQKDDLIETYLMQEKRNSQVYYYGLKSSVEIFGIKVKRPLLSKTKKELEDYCKKNNIEYGIDESNLGDDFTRNKIRHEVIDRMSIKEKNALVRKIRDLNKENELLNKKAKSFIDGRDKIPVEQFLEYDDKIRLLRYFVGIGISKKEANELIRQIKESKGFEVLIGDTYFCKEYGYLLAYKKEEDYCFVLDKIEYFKTKHFKISKKGSSVEAVCLKESDFPITIRNYKTGDSIKLRYGTKKINRFFIDRKISSKDRKMWPIMFNKDGSAILVPKIGCDIHHYAQNDILYMIKL